MENYKLGKRLIAFFDILGFSKKLEAEDTSQLHLKLASFIDEARSHVFISDEAKPNNESGIRKNFEFSMVAFDSILLVSNNLNEMHSKSNFILSCIELMKIAARFDFLLRGAIDVDEVLYDQQRDIILSKAQPRLLRYEKSQNWMGCGVSNVACELIWEDLIGTREIRVNIPILPFLIPCRPNSNLKGEVDYCLNWIVTNPTVDTEHILNLLDDNKKGNTSEFVKHIRGMDGFSQMILPPAPPVYEFRYLATRVSTSFLFMDENGRGVDPVSPFKITISEEDGSEAFEVHFGEKNKFKL